MLQQNEPVLWDELIKYAVTEPKYTSELLDKIGVALVDPIKLIKQ